MMLRPAVTFFALAVALFGYVWMFWRTRDKIRSLLAGTLFLGAGFAIGQPLLGYILDTPLRVLEQKRQKIELSLENQADFQAIRQYEPESFRTILHVLATAPAYIHLKPGEPLWNKAVRSQMAAEMRRQKYLEKASDEAVMDYARAQLSAIEALDDASGERCHDYLTHEAIDGPADLPAEVLSEDSAATAAVIETAHTNPNKEKPSEVPWQKIGHIERQLRDEFQADWYMVWDPWRKDVDKALHCRMARRFLKLMILLPDTERLTVLRNWVKPHG